MVIIMKLSNKIFIMIIMLIGMFLLAGCDKFQFSTFDASDEDNGNEITTDSLEEQEESVYGTDETPETKEKGSTDEDAKTTQAVTPTAEPIQPTANIDLSVYTINADGNIEPVIALIPQGSVITPQLVVETVVESMADQSIIIGIKDVTTKKDTVIVNFIKDKTPDKNMGSGYESAILDAIAQSLVDNLEDYSKVIYRIDDKAYVSGVYEYGIDEVYLGDN